MPSLFKEIFQLVFRRFVKDRGRFPTPAERDVLQDIAQKEARKQMENIDPVFKGVDKMDPDKPFRGFKPKVVPKEGELSVTIEGKTQSMSPEGIMDFLMRKGKAKDTNIGKAPKTTAETKKKKSMIDPKLTEEENIKRMMEENKKAVKRFEEKFGKKDREDFDIGGDVGIMTVADKKPEKKFDAEFYKNSIRDTIKTYSEPGMTKRMGPFNFGYMLDNLNRFLEEGGDEETAKQLQTEIQNFIEFHAETFQALPEDERKKFEEKIKTDFIEERGIIPGLPFVPSTKAKDGGRIGFSGGGGAGLPAATGGQTVFIGPTLPEEEDEEEVTTPEQEPEMGGRDPMEYMLNTGFQPIFPMPQMQKVPTAGGVGELREFLKSRGAQELGVGYNFPTKGGGILGVGMAPSGNVGATFLQRFEEGGPVDPDRRTFVKILGGLASIPILGKFVAPLKQAAPVVAETAKEVPAYFFKLVDKIRRLGDDAPGLTSIERESGKRYKNYEMVEDQTTGDIIIKKQKQGSTMVGDDMVEGTMSEEVLAYRTPKNTPEGRLSADYEEITVRPDFEGKMRDVEDGLDSMSEILEEVGEAQLKKAGGGLAYMLGE